AASSVTVVNVIVQFMGGFGLWDEQIACALISITFSSISFFNNITRFMINHSISITTLLNCIAEAMKDHMTHYTRQCLWKNILVLYLLYFLILVLCFLIN
ncbi:hypothetical protein ACJX0J_013679, partial [Zea mays]